MKLNSFDSQRFARCRWVALGLALGALASGCFKEEGYGNETSSALVAPVPDATGADPGAGLAGTGAQTPTGMTPSGSPMGSAGTSGGPMAGSPAPTADAGAGDPMDMPPSFMCEGVEVECVGGKAGTYPCSGVNLLAHLDGPSMQGGTGNDIWGWEDPMTGKEYVLMGLTNGTAFVDISDPCRPVHLGHMRTQTVDAIWRDLKVYKDHVYIVSESQAHGMQVFDLTQLRNVTNPPVAFKPDLVVNSFGASHNLALDEESGFAYAVTTNNCASARSFDLSNPANPVDVGCWNGKSRIHDMQCVTYKGPDAAYAGKEICFAGTEDRGVAIYDVTNKAAVTQIGGLRYPGTNYGHQGWLTDDHVYFVFGDEGDELASGIKTTTYYFDVSKLTMPTLAGTFVNTTPAIDHNLFVRGNFAFMASYTAGLRILDLTNMAAGQVSEAGYFDGYPAHDNPDYTAMWGVYPFFKSGVVVTSGSEGLFILHPEARFIQ